MNFGYQPPYGFGNDVPGRKKQPGDVDYGAQGGGLSFNTGQAGQGGLATPMVGTYERSTFDPTSMDFSSPYQMAAGSRDSSLMADAGYQQLLASLGLDEETARANTTFGVTAAQQGLVSNLSDLARQSQEDRYGIDATLRSRGVGRGSQREALQSRAYENQGRQELNMRKMTEDKVAGINAQLADTLAQLRRAEAQGAGDAAGRLQAQRDNLMAQLAQAQAADQARMASEQQNQAVLGQLAAMQAAQSAQQYPAAAAPSAPAEDPNDVSTWSPERQAAFRAYVAGQSQPTPIAAAPGPAPSAPYTPSRAPATSAPPPRSPALGGAQAGISLGAAGGRPKEPLRPIRGYY